jgi:hypothetical protein
VNYHNHIVQTRDIHETTSDFKFVRMILTFQCFILKYIFIVREVDTFYRIWSSHRHGCDEVYRLGYNVTYPLKIRRRFGETYYFHLQGRTISQERHQHEVDSKQRFLIWLIFWPWWWMLNVPPKRRLTFDGLYDVISQKTKLFGTILIWN